MGTRSQPPLRWPFLALLLAAALILAMVLSLGRPTAAAPREAVSGVESQVICQCGCTKVNAVCDCQTAADMRTEIGKMLDEGKTPKQILDSYVQRYGKTVLAAPTKQGFDITAWVTPFIAIGVAGGGLWFVLKRWAASGARRGSQGSTRRSEGSLTEQQKSRVEREFKDYF